jgi:hypothetical protein
VRHGTAHESEAKGGRRLEADGFDRRRDEATDIREVDGARGG